MRSSNWEAAWRVRVNAPRVKGVVLPDHAVEGRGLLERGLVPRGDVHVNVEYRLAASEHDHVATLDENAEALLDDLLPELGGPGDVPDVLVVCLGSVRRVDDDCRDRLVLHLLEDIETVGVDHDAVVEGGRDGHGRKGGEHQVLVGCVCAFFCKVSVWFFSNKTSHSLLF